MAWSIVTSISCQLGFPELPLNPLFVSTDEHFEVGLCFHLEAIATTFESMNPHIIAHGLTFASLSRGHSVGLGRL